MAESMLTLARRWVSICRHCAWHHETRVEWWAVIREFCHGLFKHGLLRKYTWECPGCGAKGNQFFRRKKCEAQISMHTVICDKLIQQGPTESNVQSTPPSGLN